MPRNFVNLTGYVWVNEKQSLRSPNSAELAFVVVSIVSEVFSWEETCQGMILDTAVLCNRYKGLCSPHLMQQRATQLLRPCRGSLDVS